MNSMMNLKQVPFIRILTPYGIGIGITSCFPACFYALFIVVFVATLLLILLQLFPTGNRHFRIYAGTIAFNAFLLCGMISFFLAVEHHDFPDQELCISAMVKDLPEIKERSVQLDCQVNHYSYGNIHIKTKENILLYISKDSLGRVPEIGDSICFVSKLQLLKNRGNPKEFDFVRFMRNERIFYSTYVVHDDVRFGGKSGKFVFRRVASQLQKKIIKSFADHSIKNDELAILSALAAGNREFLGDEIKNKYAVAGAMHILAVSGLHVGILYIFLSFILFRRNQTAFFKIFRLVVILLAIWFFAFITGLSSSVVRASLMFSLFLTGKSLNRQINSYNILAASALIVLVMNPLEIFKLGFQFSYLAVLGILYLQPKLFALLCFKHAIPDRIWQLITVSIAAQVSIFPLSLYHFHQFPVWFWLANVFVIPLVWLIMVLTMVFFLSLAISPVSEWVSFVINALLKVLNLLIEKINTLPFAAIRNIRFETSHLIACYLFILIFLVVAAKWKRIYCIYIAGTGIAFFLLSGWISYRSFDEKQEMIVYNYGANTVMSLIHGHNHLMLMDLEHAEDGERLMRWNRDFQIGRQIAETTEEIHLKSLPIHSVLEASDIKIEHTESGIDIQYFEKKIKILEKGMLSWEHKNSCGVHDIDCLVLGNNSGYPEQIYFSHPMPKSIIISKYMSKNRYIAWDNFALKNGIELVHLTSDGAFHIEFN